MCENNPQNKSCNLFVELYLGQYNMVEAVVGSIIVKQTADYSRTPFPDQYVTMNECQRQWITAMLT